MAGKGNPNGVPNSKATQFKKGNNANPKGAPRKLPELDKLLAEVLGEEKNGMTAAEAVLKAMLAKAARGDVKAAQLILDRAYGKSLQQIDMTTKGEKIQSTEIKVYNVGPDFADSEDKIDEEKKEY